MSDLWMKLDVLVVACFFNVNFFVHIVALIVLRDKYKIAELTLAAAT